MSYESHISTVEKGLLGTLATTGSVAVSFMAQFELYLRISGLLLGLAIGIITLLSVWRDYQRKQ
jgi:hypothetical protein